jgi:hypothetical protein
MELLERRDVPAVPVLVHPFFLIGPNASSSPVGLTPAQLTHAYGFDVIKFGNIVGNGAGQTIAIVDAFDDPKLVSSTDPNFSTSDLHNFDVQFGLPDPPSFTKLAQDGSTNYPGVDTIDPKGDTWELEESLDVEWAHALAPLANIVLVEANDNSTPNLQQIAVPLAASLPGVSVVSMSWGSDESSDETTGDSTFTTPAGHSGVTFIASTGDSGAPGEYPATSPNVLAVGGTTLSLNSNNTYKSETGWSTLPPSRTVDNGGFSFSQAGGWTTQSGGFGGTYLVSSSGTSTATWTFTGVSRTISQDVSVTWVPVANLATNATYEIFNRNTLIDTVTVNQQLAPVGISSGGVVFQKLGDYLFTTGTIRVELLASGANGPVVADAAGESEGWGSGGSVSQFESQPTYQNGVVTQSTTNRAVPDVSFDADPNSGVAVYDSYDFGSSTPWLTIGGTSMAAPSWAALIAIVNQGRVNAVKSVLDGPSQTLPMIYQLPASDFHDVTTGYNGFSAGPGYDLVTGLGSPFANLVALDLAGVNGSLDYFAPSGGTNNLLVQLNGPNIQILDNGTVVESRALATTTAINITGAISTVDILALDFSGGDPIPSGGLNFAGNTGDGDQLIVNGSAAAATFVVTGSQVQRGGDQVNYSGITSLTLNTNAANDSIDVQSTLANVSTAIVAGSGNDTILVGSSGGPGGVLANILGPISINGGSGTTTLTLDDSGNTSTADMVTVNATQVGVSGDSFFGPGGSLTYMNVASLTLNMSNAAAGDTINLTPSASTSFTVNGNNPATAPGDVLNLNLTGVTGPVLTSFTSSSGKWTFTNRQPVSYTGIEQQNEIGIAPHLLVTPGASTVIQGTAVTFTVQAVDSSNNLLTGYSGTVHFNSSDLAATLPGDATLTSGTGTVSATLRTLGNQTITATDTSNSSISGSSSAISVTATGATHFLIAAPPNATAGTGVNFTVTALDNSNNTLTNYSGTVHFTSGDGQAMLPANLTLTGGTGTFSATLKTAGAQTITATDTGNASLTGKSGIINVNAAGASHFSVNAPASATAGTAFTVTVTAQDPFNNLVTGYSGTINFSSSGGSPVLPASTTLAKGSVSFSATLKTAALQTITATDSANANLTGNSSGISVSAATANHYVVTAPGGTTAGSPFAFTVTAQDPFNNTAIAYSGTVHLTSGDGQAVLPGNATLASGTGSFSATLKTAALQTITATDAGNLSITGMSGAISVSAATASKLVVSAPTGATAGTGFNFTVSAQDFYNNLATSYSGTVQFTSSNGMANLPASSTLTGGTGTFTTTLKTAGSQAITATDAGNASLTGTSTAISVSAAAASRLVVTAPSIATAEIAFTFTITAQDPFNNTATGYTGTLAFTSSDASVTAGNGLPLSSTLTNGTGAFSATLKTFGTQTLTATDTANGSIAGTSGLISVHSGAATHFTITGPSSAIANIGFRFTVTALDVDNNLVAGYSGTVTFTSSDGQAVLPSNATLTSGTGTFSAILKTTSNQAITATDTLSPTVSGSSNAINVSEQLLATGQDVSGASMIVVYDAVTLATKFAFYPFGGVSGGVRVAAGNNLSDGVPEIVTATGPGPAAEVRVFNGLTGVLQYDFFPYGGFSGGAFVAAGDLNGDGYADIIVGPDSGMAPIVLVYDGRTGDLLRNFYAFSGGFTGGVRVAAGDVNGDGFADIITGTGPGIATEVRAFNGLNGIILRDFYVYNGAFTGGVYVGAGDVNGDHIADIIVGPGAGMGSEVQVYDGNTSTKLLDFYVGVGGSSGVRVSSVVVQNNGRADLVVGSGLGAGTEMQVIDSLSLQLVDDFFAFNTPSSQSGLFVGGG